jgi:N6-adenosine-specific RNA methylase IME4
MIEYTTQPYPYSELFARGKHDGWTQWGNEAEAYSPSWPTYNNHSHKDVLPNEK